MSYDYASFAYTYGKLLLLYVDDMIIIDSG